MASLLLAGGALAYDRVQKTREKRRAKKENNASRFSELEKETLDHKQGVMDEDNSKRNGGLGGSGRGFGAPKRNTKATNTQDPFGDPQIEHGGLRREASDGSTAGGLGDTDMGSKVQQRNGNGLNGNEKRSAYTNGTATDPFSSTEDLHEGDPSASPPGYQSLVDDGTIVEKKGKGGGLKGKMFGRKEKAEKNDGIVR